MPKKKITEIYPRIIRSKEQWLVHITEKKSKQFDTPDEARDFYNREMAFLDWQNWYLYKMEPICHL